MKDVPRVFKTFKALEAYCESIGAEAIYGRSGRYMELTVEAPSGFHWASDGIHMMVMAEYAGTQNLKEMLEEAASRMAEGIEPCNDECEYWEE